MDNQKLQHIIDFAIASIIANGGNPITLPLGKAMLGTQIEFTTEVSEDGKFVTVGIEEVVVTKRPFTETLAALAAKKDGE